MVLDNLIAGLPIRHHAGGASVRIKQVTDDSRGVETGALFIARPGTHADGVAFAQDAVKRGAIAVLADKPLDDLPANVAQLLCDDVRAMPGVLAERFYGEPAKKLTLIGVTGTNGKTTTAHLIRHLLNAVGQRCGLISTVQVDDGATTQPARLTTPGAIELSAIMARMVEHHCTACVMEASSHALDQGRVDAVNFKVGVFTNLTGDHLDYHPDMQHYAAAKARLFEKLRPDAAAVVNADDPASARMLQQCPAKVLRYGLDAADAEYRGVIDSADADGSRLTLHTPNNSYQVKLPMVGRHNVSNLLAAAATAEALNIRVGDLLTAIESVRPVPGRLEKVTLPSVDLPITVLVDYAHTDDALRNVLTALRPITRGRLRVMFGCGGQRDRSKRPRMAAVACELADDIVITSDNPRTEPADAIIAEILQGVPRKRLDNVAVEADRRRAIQKIIHDAYTCGMPDVVLLAGKGHEDYQIVGAERRPFDDRIQAREVLLKLTQTREREI
jgi:UDP-N-acetylmuramoyl-L-alanyl-D-glutamate--2,6-diaminopimelate ligase